MTGPTIESEDPGEHYFEDEEDDRHPLMAAFDITTIVGVDCSLQEPVSFLC
jgi:hypothetical protein